MRLLLDQGVPRSAAAMLRDIGFDAVHAGEIGLSAAEDPEILKRADVDGRCVVTLDADFHALLALGGAARPSVIRVRIEGLKAEAFVAVLKPVLADCAADLERGAAISIDESKVRVRYLPLIGASRRGAASEEES